jgi:hypothetical protein
MVISAPAAHELEARRRLSHLLGPRDQLVLEENPYEHSRGDVLACPALALAVWMDRALADAVILRRPDHHIMLHSRDGGPLREMPEGARGLARSDAIRRQLVAAQSGVNWRREGDLEAALREVLDGSAACLAAPLGLIEDDALPGRPIPARACLHQPLCGIWMVVGEPTDVAPLKELDDPRTRICLRAEHAALVGLIAGLARSQAAGDPLDLLDDPPVGIDCSILGAQHVLRGVVPPADGADAPPVRREVVTETNVPPEEAGAQLAEELLDAAGYAWW